MDANEIYKLADELTNEKVDKILSKWVDESNSIIISHSKEAKEKIRLFDSLVRLGDSKELACATVMLKKPIDKETIENYRFAYLDY